MVYTYEHVAVSRADGGVSIMHLVTKAPGNALDSVAAAANGFSLTAGQWWREVTDAVIGAEIARSGIDAFEWRRVKEKDIPADRRFRDAWKPDFTTDMEKARAIHRDYLRGIRDSLLAKLDVAYQRADEASDEAEKRRIADEKQMLRDITADPAIDAAATPDELAAVLPARLLTAG